MSNDEVKNSSGEGFEPLEQKDEKEALKKEEFVLEADMEETRGGRVMRTWAEMSERRRDKVLRRSIPETIGFSWFWLAALYLIGFPFLDSLQKYRAMQSGVLSAGAAWRKIFTTNFVVGLVISLPVFLAFGADFLLQKRKEEPWKEAQKKKLYMKILLFLLIVLLLIMVITRILKV